MEFYPEKFKQLRKKERFSIKEICSRAKIARTTLWEWENGKRIPSESNIRMLAKIINKSISEISDLESEKHYSKGEFSEVVDSWLSLSDINNSTRHKQCTYLIDGINKLDKELSQATIVIKALLSSLDAIFYIKDSQSRYITASDTFLENVGLKSSFVVKGKTDFDFFPKQNAENNDREDSNVLSTGKAIIHSENFIPGSRNTKWGLISKRPILDPHGKIAGLVGIFVDITERKKSEEVQALLKKCLDSVPASVILQDIHTYKTYYNNKAFENFYSFTQGEMSNAAPKEPFSTWIDKCVHPDDKKNERRYLKEKNWPTSRILRVLSPTKEIKFLEVDTIKKEVNKKECLLSILSDVTELVASNKKISNLINIMEKVDECIWLGKFNEEKEFEFTYVSKAFEKMSGLPRQSLIDNPNIWTEYVHPDYFDKVMKERIKQSNRSLLHASYEYKIVHQKTKLERIMFDSVYVENSVLFGITRDITEHQHLHKQNYQLKNLIDSSDEIVWYGEMNEKKIVEKVDYVNKSIYELTGISVEEMLSTTNNSALWHSLLHEDDISAYMEWRKAENNHKEFEYRIINTKNRKTYWVSAKNYIIDNIKYGLVRNITKKKQKEQQLKILEYSINNIDDGFWIIKDNKSEGIEDEVEYINSSYMKMFGLTEEDLTKNPNTWHNIIHPDDKELVNKMIKQTEYPKHYKYRITRPNDRQLRWISEIVYLKDGYNYGIVNDITDQKTEEQQNKNDIKIEIAKQLKKEKIDDNTIAKATELSISTIKSLDN